MGWQIHASVTFKVLTPGWGTLSRVFCFLRTVPGAVVKDKVIKESSSPPLSSGAHTVLPVDAGVVSLPPPPQISVCPIPVVIISLFF